LRVTALIMENAATRLSSSHAWFIGIDMPICRFVNDIGQ
jgi:hypothetical protein